MAYQATLQGFDVRHVEVDTEFARHAFSSSAGQAALLRSFVEPDLVVLRASRIAPNAVVDS